MAAGASGNRQLGVGYVSLRELQSSGRDLAALNVDADLLLRRDEAERGGRVDGDRSDAVAAALAPAGGSPGWCGARCPGECAARCRVRLRS